MIHMNARQELFVGLVKHQILELHVQLISIVLQLLRLNTRVLMDIKIVLLVKKHVKNVDLANFVINHLILSLLSHSLEQPTLK